MAKIIGTPGQSSRMLAQRRRFFVWLALVVFSMAGCIMLFLLLESALLKGTAAVTAGVVILVALKWLISAATETNQLLHKRTRDAERGAAGEDAIGRILAELPDGYIVFNDLSKLHGDIDHVVVGPTGLFVIETKAHGGKVVAQMDQLLMNGLPPEKNLINQAWSNAYWVRDVLKNVAGIEVKVKPILVFTNAFVTGWEVKGVRVINKKYLAKTILREKLSGLPIGQIVSILQRKMGEAGDDLKIEPKD